MSQSNHCVVMTQYKKINAVCQNIYTFKLIELITLNSQDAVVSACLKDEEKSPNTCYQQVVIRKRG